jgi:DNA-binding response OmpR family regulator
MEEKKRILLIDDDPEACQLVEKYLSKMDYEVESVHNGVQGVERAASGNYDALILDVMMPLMDGFEVLREIRKSSDVPVLMLTSQVDETDKIVGLETGADDYLPKTFSNRELLARLRAVMRRSQRQTNDKNQHEDVITSGSITINHDSREAFLDDKPLNLSPIEFSLLTCLVNHPGRVLSRDQLLDLLSGKSYEVFDRSIDMHISSLRKKLCDDPVNPKFIKTVRAAGYMFISQN